MTTLTRPGPEVDPAPALEIRGLRKVYGGTVALADVDLTVRAGEIHALLGENGAGKSTLVRLLAGVDHEDAGSIALAGETVPSRRTPRFMAEQGVAFIHQDLGLVDTMTVAENIALYAGFVTGPLGISWTDTHAAARQAMAELGVRIDPNTVVAELSIAEQATVAIVRALSLSARVIVLDEPTASLAAQEADQLLEILRRLRATGVACVIVTHRIDEVLEHCDRVTVLRNGRLVATRDVENLTQDLLVEMIVGRLPQRLEATRREAVGSGHRLELRAFRGAGFGPIDLAVSPGELVAITGFADAGHLALVDALYGAAPCDGGSVYVDGERYRPSSPRRAMASGFQQVPSDRDRLGLAATLTARENLFPNPQSPRCRPIDRAGEHRRAVELITEFDIRPSDSEAEVSVFSGGNAQKLLLARVLAAAPRVLLLGEPTAGVDIGARSGIYGKLREACARGLSVVMASSDFQEVAEISDRVAVLRRGTVECVLEREQISVAALVGASYGR